MPQPPELLVPVYLATSPFLILKAIWTFVYVPLHVTVKGVDIPDVLPFMVTIGEPPESHVRIITSGQSPANVYVKLVPCCQPKYLPSVFGPVWLFTY